MNTTNIATQGRHWITRIFGLLLAGWLLLVLGLLVAYHGALASLHAGGGWRALFMEHWPYLLLAVSGVGALGLGWWQLRRLFREACEREASYRFMVASMAEGVVVQDVAGRIVDCNEQATTILGLTRAQLVGRSAQDSRWQAIREDGSAFLREEYPATVTLRTGKPCQNVVMGLPLQEGRRRWINLNVEPMFLPGETRPHLVVISFLDITAQRQEAEQRRQLLAAVEHCSVGIVITDPEGAIVYSNPRMQVQTGYTPAELQGQNPRIFQSGQTPRATYETLWQTVLAGREWHGELLNRRKNGETYWESVAVSPVKDVRGRVAYLVAIKEDISARKQGEQALQDSQRQNQLGMELARMAPWDYDVAANQYVFNDAFYALYGTTAAQQGGYRMDPETYARRFLPPESGVRVAEALRQYRESPGDFTSQMEHRIVRGDGVVRDIIARYTVVHDAAGRFVKHYGVNQDITERKQVEENLQQSEAAYRRQFEESAAAMLLLDPTTGLVVGANAAAGTFYGYSRAQLEQMPLSALSTQPAGEIFQMLESVAAGPGRRFEQSHKRADGSICAVDMAVTPVVFGGRPVLHAIVFDMTARRQAEAKLTERTQQLEVARQRAEQANRAKSEYLTVMSHEIRTPMHSVVHCTDLLLRTEPTSKQREYLEIVRSAGESLLAMSKDVLDFAQIEAGNLTLVRSPMEVRQISREVVEMLRTAAEEKKLDLQYDCDASVPDVLLGDGPRFRQILGNLLGNALAFTDHGRVALLLRATAQPDGWQLEGSVIDSGLGISSERQAQLFESFSLRQMSPERHLALSELALMISHRLVLAMGGRLWVESEPGRGSQFHFVIPLAAGEAASVAPVVASPARRALSILVVDDFVINRKIVGELLQQLGHRFDVATDGAEAVAQAGRQSYDAILMDLYMPNMGGLEATRRIRAQEAGQRRPTLIVAVTAFARADVYDNCQAAGMDEVLVKPFRLAEVERVLALVPPLPAGA